MTICSTTVTWRLPTEKPNEPCSILVMFKPDNEFGLTAKYPVQVEFDMYTAHPRQLTWFDGYQPNIIDDEILCWCELPMPPSAELISV